MVACAHVEAHAARRSDALPACSRHERRASRALGRNEHARTSGSGQTVEVRLGRGRAANTCLRAAYVRPVSASHARSDRVRSQHASGRTLPRGPKGLAGLRTRWELSGVMVETARASPVGLDAHR